LPELMRAKLMEHANLWLTTIGVGILIAAGIGAYFSDRKVLGIWLFYFGAVVLLFLGALQWIDSVRPEESGHSEPVTANQKRSIVYIEYPQGAPEVNDIGKGNKGITIHLALRNRGDVPATINRITTHLYIAQNEPDPEGSSGAAAMEDFALSDPDGLSSQQVATGQLVIPPGESKALTKTVGFERSKIDGVNGPGLQYRYLTLMWLRCVVVYEDVYGKNRETSYYVRVSGTGTLPAEHKQYNYLK
jgi:hypothetical protein